MNPYAAVGITIGLLAGIWTWASGMLGLITWVAFVTWALFFAVGGKGAGIAKVVPPALTGVVYGAIVVALATAMPGSAAWIVPVGVAVIAFLMCLQANWSVLAFIPAAFAGCAALFGGAGDWLGVAVALILGAGFGWLSEWTAGFLTRPRRAAQEIPAGEPQLAK